MNELINEYNEKKKLINQLRSSLDSINKEKEFWFRKKEAIKKEIYNLILKVKEFKSKRDQDNVSIENFKRQRDKYNDEVKVLIKRLTKLNDEKEHILKKYNLRIDPSKIQEKINDLERKVETEADYKKEKKYMEEIKKLKKVYDESSETIALGEKISLLSAELRISRSKANEFHKKIIEALRDKPYSNFIRLTKQITELKKEQEDAFNKFVELKDKFQKYNELLKSNMNGFDESRDKLKQNNLLAQVDKREVMKEMLQEKSKKVEEKIKQRKKLTTEDLLVFQARK